MERLVACQLKSKETILADLSACLFIPRAEHQRETQTQELENKYITFSRCTVCFVLKTFADISLVPQVPINRGHSIQGLLIIVSKQTEISSTYISVSVKRAYSSYNSGLKLHALGFRFTIDPVLFSLRSQYISAVVPTRLVGLYFFFIYTSFSVPIVTISTTRAVSGVSKTL